MSSTDMMAPMTSVGGGGDGGVNFVNCMHANIHAYRRFFVIIIRSILAMADL